MFIVTILAAGALGLGIVLAPEPIKARLHATCDVIPYGTLGAVWLAMGIIAIFGLCDPLKFVPLLLLQLIYKVVWITSVFVPLWMTGTFPERNIVTAVLFGLIIAGDLIAIPFRYLFAKPSRI
jgi:hypothetical protein